MILKPDSRREPLASMAITRSCVATQISSPLQSCSLHFFRPYRYLESALGHLPWPRAVTVTRLHFSWKPPLQATEHGDHLDHFFSLQLRSHDPVLQLRLSEEVPQFIPAFLGKTRIERVLLWTPPPHSAVQVEKEENFDILQSIGHL